MLKVHNGPMPHHGAVNIELLMMAPYNAFWKRGDPFVRSQGGVDVLVDTLGAIAPQPLVMVRSEYPQIFQHILELSASTTKRCGFVVTGHPGIGKSLFIYYALGAALSARIPVVLCNRDSFCVLFDCRGVHKIHDFSRAEFPRRTVFLVDSNSTLHSPPSVFLDPNFEGVIVQAASPEPSRWTSWTKEVHTSYWVVAPWKREEILALQRIEEAFGRPTWTKLQPGTAVYTPVEIFDLLGPCPRTCMRMAGRVKSQDGTQADFEAYLSLPALLSTRQGVMKMVSSRHAPPDWYESSQMDRVFFLYNARGSNPAHDDPLFSYAVPTLFLCRMLYARLGSEPMSTQLLAASKLAGTASTATPFYLPRALDLLLKTRATHTCHVDEFDRHAGKWSHSYTIGPNLSLRTAATPFSSDSGTSIGPLDDNTVTVVPPSSYAGSPCPPSSPSAFHALVVSENKTRVTLLRMVALAGAPGPWPYTHGERDRDRYSERRRRGSEGESIRAAFDALGRVLPRPEEVRWSLVYVALCSKAAKRAAKWQFEAVEILGLLCPRVKVGWMELRSGERDERALLKAFEKKAQEVRERHELQGRRESRKV